MHLLAVMRGVLDGRAPRDADIHHAEGVLRLFGLAPEAAAEVARRPLRQPRRETGASGPSWRPRATAPVRLWASSLA